MATADPQINVAVRATRRCLRALPTSSLTADQLGPPVPTLSLYKRRLSPATRLTVKH